MGFENPNVEEQDSAQMIEDEEEILPAKLDMLPPLKDGYMRLVHLTSPAAAEDIVKSGLHYEKQGMISSTAEAWSHAEDVRIDTEDPRFAGATKAVVLDVPTDEFKLHNSVTQSPGAIPPEYIVGVIDRNPAGQDRTVYKRKKVSEEVREKLSAQIKLSRRDAGLPKTRPQSEGAVLTPQPIASETTRKDVEDVW